MKEISVIEELKNINLSIGQKMFAMSKTQDCKRPPSPLQFKILGYLIEHQDESINQRDLETNLNVSKATISEVLLTMEKKGIITRSSSKTDGRIKNIELTSNSIKRFNEMQNIAKTINENLIKDINKKELDIFLLVLENMKQNLNKI